MGDISPLTHLQSDGMLYLFDPQLQLFVTQYLELYSD